MPTEKTATGGTAELMDPINRRELEQELPPEHICSQCGKPMGYQGFLNPVCGKCCRENHKRVAGKR